MYTSFVRHVSVAVAAIAASLLLSACGGGVSERTPLGGEGASPSSTPSPAPEESESPSPTPSDPPTNESPTPPSEDGGNGGGGAVQTPNESDAPPPGVDFSLPSGPIGLDGRNELADPNKVRLDPNLAVDANEEIVPLEGFDPNRWKDIPTDESQSGDGLTNSGGGLVTDSPDQSAIPAE